MASITDGTAVFKMRDKREQALIDLIYPVGSIYITEKADFDPNTSWGGTWVKTAVNRVLQGTDTANKVGATVEAGLPNIVGGAGSIYLALVDNLSGPFVNKQRKENGSIEYNITSGNYAGISFDASHANSIYGNSNTVQPPAELVFIWKRTA